MKLVCLLAVFCACGAGTRPEGVVANRPGPQATETLAAALTREIGAGRSVAIVGGQAGLRAISSDGMRQRVLVPGAVPWVIVDPCSDVVWFDTGWLPQHSASIRS